MSGSNPTDSFAGSRWHSALTLLERIAILGEGLRSPKVDVQSVRRLRRWLCTPAFAIRSNLTHFLKCHGLNEEQFASLLGATLDAKVGSVAVPDWANELLPHLSKEREPALCYVDSMGFSNLVASLAGEYVERLRVVVRVLNEQFPHAIDAAAVVTSLSDELNARLLLVITRPLILEVNIARLQNALKGSTPEDRFDSFRRLLETPSFRNRVFSEYPVLARRCVTICRQWLDGSSEFLGRYCRDRQTLGSMFGCPVAPTLVAAETHAGEFHQGGRRVVVVACDQGLRLVYKPRPLGVVRQFQSMVEWLNVHGQEPKLRCIAVLDRGDYGWVEYVAFEECTTEVQIEHFFRRQGSLLAILHIIGATDCHFENVIASGEHPVVIDVETLFQPRFISETRIDSADMIAERVLSESVVAVGLLPRPMRLGDQLVDLSGLGGEANQDTPLETFGVEQPSTDVLRIARVSYKVGDAPNRPTMSGSRVSIGAHVEAIQYGFSSTYGILLSHRSELLSSEGPLAGFAHMTVRVLLRPTAVYSALLEESCHPNALYDELERERILGQLWWPTASQLVLRKTVFSEYKQMLDGDVPYFSSQPSSVDILSADGETIPGAIETSGLLVAHEKMHRMESSDLARQQWLIRATVASLVDNGPEGPARVPFDSAPSYLELALAVGEQLDETAIKTSAGASWLSFDATGSAATADFAVGVVGTDLYDGLAGIVFFLAYLDSSTNDGRYRALAERALHTLECRLPDLRRSTSIGGFNGIGGVIYVYSHLGNLWRDPTLIARADELIDEIRIGIPADSRLDLTDGSAGAAMCLLALHSVQPRTRALECAIACGDYILASLVAPECAPARKASLRYHRGASHGYAGIAWSLCALGSASGESRFLDAGVELAHRERCLLRGSGWTDPDDSILKGQATWCHGAPGIALCRLAMYQRLGQENILQDAMSALHETSRAAGTGNHGLCHGDLGNVETLLFASQTLNDSPGWAALAHGRASRICGDIAANGWRSARPGAVEVPGLMTGISGIGLEFLRLAHSSDVPSVLLLEPLHAEVDNAEQSEKRTGNGSTGAPSSASCI